MTKDKFTWVAAETFTRSKGGAGGVHLEPGKVYDVGPFDPAVVAEWVRTGHAKWAGKENPVKKEN